MTKMIIGLALSIGGLYVAFHEIDPSALGSILMQVKVIWILLAMGLLVISVWIRAVRWRILIGPIKEVRIMPLFSTTMIGYFGNAVLPLRLGEFLRAYSLHKEETSITAASALGTIVIERLLDMIGLVAVTVVIFSLYDVPFWLLNAGIFFGLVVVGSLFFLWWAWRSNRNWMGRLENLTLLKGKTGSKVRYLIRSFAEGLIVLKKTPRFPVLLAYTAVLWVIYLAITQFSAIALGISLSWVEVGVILVATTMVISIPSAPGYVGTYHAAAVLIMVEIFGKPESASQGYAILNHAVGFIPVVIIGFLFLLRSSLRLGEIRELKIEGEKTG